MIKLIIENKTNYKKNDSITIKSIIIIITIKKKKITIIPIILTSVRGRYSQDDKRR